MNQPTNNLLNFIVAILLSTIYVLITVTAIVIIDINKQEEVINNQSNTILQLTSKVIEQQVILSEVEELLRIREDLSKVLP